MKVLRYSEYFSSSDIYIQSLDATATMKVLKEKQVNGYRICLVVKEKSLGVDLFYKNGNFDDFIQCKDILEAINLYKNGLAIKYRLKLC